MVEESAENEVRPQWKIMTGTIMLALAELLPLVLPEYQQYKPFVQMGAVIIGGYGISDRFNKIKKEIVNVGQSEK